MKRIIDWLIQIEKMAHRFYAQSAEQFPEPTINTFLRHAADDENQHHKIMRRALKIVESHPKALSAIGLDEETKQRVEHSFQRNQRKLNANSLTIEALIDCIVETELSEWNHVFTYVVNSLKTSEPEFKGIAAGIQHHLRQMVHFLESHPYGQSKIERLKALTPVWQERILIVDDNPEILTLLGAVLKTEGHVITAENGHEAMAALRKSYFCLIISDVDMPVMNGLDFYRQAAAEFPGIRQRFVFLTGGANPNAIDFFSKYKVKHLTKPASIQQVKALFHESMNDISIAV